MDEFKSKFVAAMARELAAMAESSKNPTLPIPEFLDFLEAGVKNAPEGNPFAEALRDVVKR